MDMGSNYTPQEWEAWKQEQRAAHNNGNGHGASLTQEALTMLPTPITQMENRKSADYGLSLMHTLIGESTPRRSAVGSGLHDQPQIPHINEQDDNDSTQPSLSG
jgi:hypothetical protein